MQGHTPEGKVSKCYTKTFPPGSNFAKRLSSATGLKNVFCAPCVFPRGLVLVTRTKHIINSGQARSGVLPSPQSYQLNSGQARSRVQYDGGHKKPAKKANDWCTIGGFLKKV